MSVSLHFGIIHLHHTELQVTKAILIFILLKKFRSAFLIEEILSSKQSVQFKFVDAVGHEA